MTSAVWPTARTRAVAALNGLLVALALVAGCGRGAAIIPAELRKPIDRSVVEFPADTQFERYISNLNSPSAMAFDTQKETLLVAESGADGSEPRILGFNHQTGETFTVYPQGKVFGPFRTIPFRMFGPVGGMAVHDGVIYVSHRDKNGFGVISAVGYDGKGKTIVAGLPAQGDHGVTDLAFYEDRLFFGVGSVTNSGVVGLDNFAVGWVHKHPKLADRLYVPPNANEPPRFPGQRFFTPNPFAGLFSGSELAITGPLQPFGQFYRSKADRPPGDKPNSAIYSIDPSGGVGQDVRIEAHGIRMPAGLAFFPGFPTLYTSNQGMELRGTRPVLLDPDVVLKILPGPFYYGFPDFSADLYPITDRRFQPPEDMIRRTGYSELTPLLYHDVDYLRSPVPERDNVVRAVFPTQSGAAKMAFVPDNSPLKEFRRQLLIAQTGDRTPFANSNRYPLKMRPGYKVVTVDVESDRKIVNDFIRNTAGVPRSLAGGNWRKNPDMLERPIDVKFGPDGYLYVLDFGRLEVRNGKPSTTRGTGQVFRLLPAGVPSTGPTPRNAQVEEDYDNK